MPRTIRWLIGALGILIGFLAVLQGVLVTVFRNHWRPGIEAIRRFNRALLNPLMMRRAGSAGWYASAIEHHGRRSGKMYVTPVVAERSGAHVVIPLPYGSDVDWCRNVLAAGEADLDSDGVHFHLVSPVVIDAAEAAPLLPDRLRSRLSRYGVDEYLRLDAA